jgi:hypothetical protein
MDLGMKPKALDRASIRGKERVDPSIPLGFDQ